MKKMAAFPAALRQMGALAKTDAGEVVRAPYYLKDGDVVCADEIRTQPGRVVTTKSRLDELLQMAIDQGLVKAGEADDDFADRLLTMTASDETVDRYGDIILVDGEFRGKKYGKGWQLKNWAKNPVILPGHQGKEIPVGNAIDTWTEVKAGRKRLRVTMLFAGEDVNPAAPRYQRAYQRRILRAGSVGFLPVFDKIFEPETKEERAELGLGKYGLLFGEHELLEHSLVTVPANPNALEGRDVAGLLRFADELGEVNDDLGRAVRGQVFRGVGYSFPETKASEAPIEGPPLTPVPDPGDDARNAPVVDTLVRLADAVGVLSENVTKMTGNVEALASRIAERARVEDESGSRRTAGDPPDSDLYEPLLAGYKRMAEIAGHTAE